MSDYIVLKIDDVNKYLGHSSRRKLANIVSEVERKILKNGQKLPEYGVIEETKPIVPTISEKPRTFTPKKMSKNVKSKD